MHVNSRQIILSALLLMIVTGKPICCFGCGLVLNEVKIKVEN